jgi:cytochrome b6-f complex iron-sulfur subunit
MERRNFIKNCCYSAGGILIGSALFSCDAIYYASFQRGSKRLVISKKEFISIKNEKVTQRKFVLIKKENGEFPLCIYKVSDDVYHTSLLKCTHNGCELNVGGGIYTCPCHGSEFSVKGKVLEGPADRDLKIFKTQTDNENIYILQA